MRILIFVLCVIAMTNHIAQAQDWKLVWSDEFDYTGLPDPAKWDYEVGFVRNAEKQYYTKARLENARVENGKLIIEGRKEQYPNHKYKADSNKWQERDAFASYTAASLITRNIQSWQYGRFEVKAKIPQGKGAWPAIWTLGDKRNSGLGWPRCGEIDIMEFVGKQPDTIHATAHFSINGKHKSKGNRIKAEKPFDDFHIYAIEWFEDHIDFFYDDNKYFTFNTADAKDGDINPFQMPHYLLINLALGGSWGGELDDAILPQKYMVDYVRIYQQNK